MDICQRCSSDRILNVSAKCSDQFEATVGKAEHEGDVPRDLGIGGGDYLRVEICLDCGQLQGDFPLPLSDMEEENINGDDDNDDDDRYDGGTW